MHHNLEQQLTQHCIEGMLGVGLPFNNHLERESISNMEGVDQASMHVPHEERMPFHIDCIALSNINTPSWRVTSLTF